jgi:hypothetical protein
VYFSGGWLCRLAFAVHAFGRTGLHYFCPQSVPSRTWGGGVAQQWLTWSGSGGRSRPVQGVLGPPPPRAPAARPPPPPCPAPTRGQTHRPSSRPPSCGSSTAYRTVPGHGAHRLSGAHSQSLSTTGFPALQIVLIKLHPQLSPNFFWNVVPEFQVSPCIGPFSQCKMWHKPLCIFGDCK